MALASLADVRRVLRLTDDDETRDVQLAEALAVADDWVRLRIKSEFDTVATAGTPETTKYYDVREDGLLALPVRGATVEAVRLYAGEGPEPTYTGAVEVNYEVQDDTYVRLRPDLTTSPFEGASARRLPHVWQKVEIDWSYDGSVPAPVRDAVAIIAAGVWERTPRLTQGIASESLGDYSYSLGSGDTAEAGIPAVALRLLRPYRRRRSLVP